MNRRNRRFAGCTAIGDSSNPPASGTAGAHAFATTPVMTVVDASSRAEYRRSMPEYAVPVLPGRDLRQILRFYESLGFENRGAEPEEWDYLIVGRGGLELHFSAEPELDPFTTAASCYAFVDDAQALHDEWAAIVVNDPLTGSRLMPPMLTEYGMTEFALVDPSGNLIRVGSPIPR